MVQVRQRRPPASAVAVSSSVSSDAKPTTRRRDRRFRSFLPRGWPVVVGFCAFYVSAYAIVTFWHTWLPEPKGLDAPRYEFSEARARTVLEQMMRFGYRPVGTKANEELTPQYLLQQIHAIQTTTLPGASVEVDVQRPSGAFGLDFIAQFQNIYANVTNILVKVSPPNATLDALNNSLMISSHYDAAIGGAAASDDGVNIAIMMELLRLVVLNPPRHATLVFNFNGAEETIMQAAHGFITQHPWTETIRAFINLEAAGAGGRELLFQTGSDELALAYAQGAKYPHASIIAQELFQSGYIPADTDYRVYRDFGYVAGMDFAYIANGYVYHTMLDDISRIQPGSIQRLGENLVGVVYQLGSEPGRLKKVGDNPQSSNTFFSDIMGLTMVTASKEATFFTCGVVLVLAALYLLLSRVSFFERWTAIVLTMRCIGAAIASSFTVGVLLSLYAPLPWYSQPYLAGPLYLSPAIAGMLHQMTTVLEKQVGKVVLPKALWRLEESLFEAALCVWMGILAICLQLGFISSYVLALWIFFPLVGQVLCQLLQRFRMLSSGLYISIALGATIIPVIHTMCCFAIALMFFIPLLGRSGPVLPPDVILSLLMCTILLIMVSYAGRVFCFFPAKQLKLFRDSCIIITVISTAYASIRNPYSDICPKRLMLQHVQRKVMLSNGDVQMDSGLWINSLDFRGLDPIKDSLVTTQWNHAHMQVAPQELHEHAEVYGHMPWSLPVKHMLPEDKSWYLLAAAPAIPNDADAKLEVVSSTYVRATDRRTIHFVFSGPSHMNLFIDAKRSKLTSWSMGNGMSGPVAEAEDAYILQFCSGTVPSNYHFWIEAESNRSIDVVFVAHYLELITPEMTEFSDALPSWTATSSAVSTWTKMQI